MGKTVVEKIIANHIGKEVQPGDLIVTDVDGVMATDTTAPLAIKAFKEMGGQEVFDPKKCALILDHAVPPPNERIANLHRMMRIFAEEQGIRLFDIGDGICHQVMVENAYVRPGDIFIGADSHTPTYGAVNAMACGVGSTDLAATMMTGKIWLKVPQSIKIQCNGQLQTGVSAKDLILYLVGKITISGATYKSVEFHGEAFEPMTVASRMTVANMVAEMGGKTAIVHPSGLQLDYDYSPILPDDDAHYEQEFSFDVSQLEPQVAAPSSPDNVVNVSEHEGTPIQYAFIGTCCNGRLEDLQAAAAILKGNRIKNGVRMLVAPASRKVMISAMNDGTLQTLMDAGVSIITPGCGPCVGTHQGVPGNDETVISAANRNFRGRMGNPNSNIYLAAPATVAASALAGKIVHPKNFMN